MLQSEIIRKLAMELSIANGDFDHYKNNCIYIQMALSIGLEHFHRLEEEVVVMTTEGIEIGRYKSVNDTSRKLGIHVSSISETLRGNRASAGGLHFMWSKDYDLQPREQKKEFISKNEL